MVRVLITGNAVVDYVFHMAHMPDEAQKYRAHGLEVIGGGIAANAAVAIARLGGNAQLVTRLGNDTIGQNILAELRAEGVDLSAVVVSQEGRSPMSSVIVDQSGARMLVNFPGENLPKEADIPDEFDAVLVDTRWPEAALASVQKARACGKVAVLDAEAPVPEQLVALATHTVFSAQGLRAFTGADTPEEGMALLAHMPGWQAVTDGPRGLYTPETDWIAAPKVEAIDTLGAGDVWHGAFTLALAEGQSLKEAIHFAHGAAALKCTAFGGRKATPTRKTLDHFLQEQLL